MNDKLAQDAKRDLRALEGPRWTLWIALSLPITWPVLVPMALVWALLMR